MRAISPILLRYLQNDREMRYVEVKEIIKLKSDVQDNNDQGIISFNSPSFTRISTTSTSYSVMAELMDDTEEGMKPAELEGEVEAMSA
jgi:hypothetical protein